VIDEQTSRAYELSARADMLAQRGELEQARALMSEAARLDGTYSVRAELLGVADPRPVKVASSVRKLLRPFLLEAGFQCNPLGLANGDGIFERVRGTVTHSLLIGRHKLGGRLRVNAARYSDPSAVSYFDWRVTGIRTASLAYRTQRELEAVCGRWTQVLTQWVFPWLETGTDPGAPPR